MKRLRITNKSDDGIEQFRSSCSLFREKEQKALNIEIVSTNNLNDIFYKRHHGVEINSVLKAFLLPEFDEGRIRSYIPSKSDGLSVSQRRFLVKLKLVLANNDPDSESSRCERFIDDLITFICGKAGLDDGLELTLRPCNLYLKIGDESFAAIADKEGRRGIELAWLIQEDRHKKSSTYKHGDLQLACAMISAAQQNYNLLEKVYPPKIIGIKMVAHNVNFCSMTLTQRYVEDLYEGLPDSSVVMYKLDQLSLSVPDERRLILHYLSILHAEAMAITPMSA